MSGKRFLNCFFIFQFFLVLIGIVSIHYFKSEIINPIIYIVYFLVFIVSIYLVSYYLNEKIFKPLNKFNTKINNIDVNSIQETETLREQLLKKENCASELKSLFTQYYNTINKTKQKDKKTSSAISNNSNKIDITSYDSRLEELSKKLECVVDVFGDIYKLSKEQFLNNIFKSAFDLIPEAEKGTYFELQGEKYNPILSQGYDLNTIKNLEFSKSDIHVGFEGIKENEIDAYESCVNKRDEEKMSIETINILKKLGTYSNFKSLYAPIKVNGVNIGIICLDNFNNLGFNKDSKKLLKYYAQLISEFYSQRISQEKLRKTYYDVVTALVSAIEVKDSYTQGHGKRVQKYSRKIAEKMNLSDKKIHNISIAALLHDVGKIGISKEILNKPGRLTEKEYNLIKKHPMFSKKIVEKISGFSEVKDLIYAHHEYYDGSGYPLGLKGHELPIEAQIIQVADAYDAMTSDRSYRKAMSNEKAISIIRNESGKQFHPRVVQIAINDVFTKKHKKAM